MRCTVTGDRYTVYGYAGKQVRDNIHSADLVRAFAAFHASPRAGAVYNIGGGRATAARCARQSRCASRSPDGPPMGARARASVGDHRWWISDLTPFTSDYPDWRLEFDLERILTEIHDANLENWTTVAR